MTLESVIEVLVNNGVAVACVAYFMWYNNTTLKTFTESMNKLADTIDELIRKVDDLDEMIKGYNRKP